MRRILASAIAFALLVGALAIWWSTSHIDKNGRLPKPAMVIRVPGGFFQATGMQDGLHCICMRDRNRRGFSIQFDRASYLGSAGYHGGNPRSFGGFTFAILTKTFADSDLIISPYAAMVFPYWFLVAASACLLLYASGIARLVLRTCLGRSFRPDQHRQHTTTQKKAT